MILDLLRRRCSVRRFLDRPVPDEVIAEILEAGRLSPSGGNEQPWKFGVIAERALIAEIAAAACGQQWLAAAPLLVVLCATIVADERGARDIQRDRFPAWSGAVAGMDCALYARLNLEEHQTKIPGTHMALAALERGVGSTWVSRFDVDRVAALLGLPEDCIPSEILAFGYPVEPPAPRPKKPLAELVFHNRFAPR
ncbi:MAG TPA: nitroreductase family protein [Anaerolineae bacterium]|nr:nitroreductase family protein [Anaerolineae bacterium]HOG45510.1 nitroreductase family protein [Anaerolineae bacterium]HOR00290.1 nitroreductase family protein [Anaerolineae bacterium]HPL27063.1 nitroreductase family protein [Anaerolineae bacterium]